MITDFIDALFGGCAHSKYGWPRRTGSKCYVVCSECCKPLAYDWKLMKVVSDRRTPNVSLEAEFGESR